MGTRRPSSLRGAVEMSTAHDPSELIVENWFYQAMVESRGFDTLPKRCAVIDAQRADHHIATPFLCPGPFGGCDPVHVGADRDP